MKVAVLRVAFEPDNSPATTGDGSFVLEDTFDLECTDWSLDPPPHDRSYFFDHLTAINNYWQRVSNGAVQVNFDESNVFPLNQDEVYELPHPMLYYHPYLEPFDETGKLFELSRDVLALADPDINFGNYTTIIIAHAGMGGDFAFALDPTPGNIPSAYLAQSDFDDYGPLETDEGALTDLIIIPESQNFLQFKETRSLFEDAEDPCFYQVGLNGTLALMFGFHLGLQPLYNTETGVSLVGGFALMDQGSNNFHGIVPAYPDPYTRIKMGWILPVEKQIGDTVAIHVDDPPVKISISETEYYLVENRQRNLLHPSSMSLWIDDAGYDTVSVVLSTGGVVLQVDEQHAGLPGNGLNIWHIDESAQYTDDNPNGGPIQMVDFVEADGAQDMGHQTQLLFADYLETGWWFDPWFAGNEGWFHLNRYEDVVGDSLLSFSSTTFPATTSNTGLPSHLRIENISKNGASMSFSIASDRLVRSDTISSIIGWGADAQIWAFNQDSSQIAVGEVIGGRLTSTSNALLDPSIIFSSGNYSYLFRYPWLAPELESGVRFYHIISGNSSVNATLDSLFEFSEFSQQYMYFAKRDGDYVQVIWQPLAGQSTIFPLIDHPLTRFLGPSGFQIFYGPESNIPTPAGVRHQDTNAALEGTDVLSWSQGDAKLKITHLQDNGERFLEVEKPLHIVPLDIDDDGVYEIALFYSTEVRIINQSGIVANGNPFPVEAYYGNPLVGPMVNGEMGIFLRHANAYSIFSLNGEMLDIGVLDEITDNVENSMRVQADMSLILSNNQLLYFEHENSAGDLFWSDPQGNASGDRVVVLSGTPNEVSVPIKAGSAYNYPNPVKGNTTTIRAWLGDVDTWKIEIFSLSGAQVAFAELDVTQKNSYNEWVWDTSALSNGVYLAQIAADGKAEIVKIAIIR
ncbi:MAG: T9SS type A sorting domain-containing protein [Candidatus Marinimicrobia bacterium]|nr:T9SS type A sorting domain-containing protein [Candidatus Neomarinimicrobiota bacterium]